MSFTRTYGEQAVADPDASGYCSECGHDYSNESEYLSSQCSKGNCPVLDLEG